MPSSIDRKRRALVLGAAAAALLTVLVAHARHYYFLCDDAYITFRYARNWALGRGLVFNPGERVEGYTSPLWALHLAIGERLGLSSESVAPALGFLYAGLALLACVAIVLQQELPFRREVAVLSIGLLAINRTWAVWTSGGLETRAFTFFVLASLYMWGRALREAERRARIRRLAGTSVLLALATLTRPDAQIFLPLFVGFWLAFSGRDLHHVAALVGPFALLIGAHYVWRRAYYGYWLPNTYYAKVPPESSPDLGFRYFAAFALENGYYLTLPLAVAAFTRIDSKPTRRSAALAAACIAVHAAYYCWRVGGDVFEFRIFDFYVPVIAWVLAEALVSAFREWPARTAVVAGLGVAYSGMIPLSAAIHSREIAPRDRFRPGGQFPVTRENTPGASILPGAPLVIRGEAELLETLYGHYVGLRQEMHRLFWQGRARDFGRIRGFAERGLLPTMTIADGSIGVLGYYVDVPVIDVLGLTDAEIAHHGIRAAGRAMGHGLRPPPGYLEKRHVNAVLLPPTERKKSETAGPEVLLMGLMFAPSHDPPQLVSARLKDGVWLNLVSPDTNWIGRSFRREGDHWAMP